MYINKKKALNQRKLTYIMLSSYYTHITLVLSCIIFSFSFFSLIKRIQTHHNVYLLRETAITNSYDDYQSSAIAFTTKNKKISNRTDEQINEKYLREKILGTNKISQSILHRFKFINPPKSVCTYPKDTRKFMIILILSRGLNFDYRQVIRATWGRNGKHRNNNFHIKTIFFVGTDDTVQSAIRDEQKMFNDVVEIGKKFKLLFV